MFTNSCGHIGNIDSLARALDIDKADLIRESNNYPGRYRLKPKKKKDGSLRYLNIPNDCLKNIQRRINGRIFSTVRWPFYIFGGISSTTRGTDYIAAAQYHSNSGIKAEIDIADYFPSVDSSHVVRIYRKFFRFPEDLAETLACLSVHLDELPQGAPTSVALSQLVFFDLEPRVVENINSHGTRYSRFLDDVVLTHPDVNHNIDIDRRRIERMIDQRGFELNPAKTIPRLKKYSGLYVFGFIASHKTTQVTKAEVRLVKKRIHVLKTQAKTPNFRKHPEFHHSWHSVSGQLNKLQRFEHPKYAELRAELKSILPLLPDSEVKSLAKRVKFLEDSAGTIKNKAASRTFYNKLRNRIGLLSRSHPATARSLLDRLNNIRYAFFD